MQALPHKAAATHVDGGGPGDEVGKLLPKHACQQAGGGGGVEAGRHVAAARRRGVHSARAIIKRVFCSAASAAAALQLLDLGIRSEAYNPGSLRQFKAVTVGQRVRLYILDFSLITTSRSAVESPAPPHIICMRPVRSTA